jgi:hypothetical protein
LIGRSDVKRDWSGASGKAQAALGCRVCGRYPWERAHVMPRARDRGAVLADDVVMLCPEHHRAYDAGRLDLWEHLTESELRQAVRRAGGAGLALRRVSAPRWRDPGAGALLDARLDRLEELCKTWSGEPT